jgi:hypothetical protein
MTSKIDQVGLGYGAEIGDLLALEVMKQTTEDVASVVLHRP